MIGSKTMSKYHKCIF